MKKFVLITVGFAKPTPADMQKWMQWFEAIGDKILSQVGLMNGKEVNENKVSDLAMDANALTGYVVINAQNMEEALAIAKACPAVTSTQVYEVRG